MDFSNSQMKANPGKSYLLNMTKEVWTLQKEKSKTANTRNCYVSKPTDYKLTLKTRINEICKETGFKIKALCSVI